MRRRSFSRRFSINKFRFLIYIPIVGIAFASFFFADSYFKIKNIKVKSSAPKTNLKGFENLKDRNLLLLKEDEVKKILTTANPEIKDIHVAKQYPDSILISLSFAKPTAVLEVNSGHFFLGKDGKILSKEKENKNSNLPTINYYQKLDYTSYTVASNVNHNDIQTALKLLESISDLGLSVVAIDMAGPNMIAFKLKNKDILFASDKKIDLQIYQLNSIIKQFKIEGKEFKTLDLRFDKPIIKF